MVALVFFTAAIILAPRYLGEGAAWLASASRRVVAPAWLLAVCRAVGDDAQIRMRLFCLGFISLLVFAPALTAYEGPRLQRQL